MTNDKPNPHFIRRLEVGLRSLEDSASVAIWLRTAGRLPRMLATSILLVEFQRDADWSLLDHVGMEEELSGLFGRSVDLVTRRAVEQSKTTSVEKPS